MHKICWKLTYGHYRLLLFGLGLPECHTRLLKNTDWFVVNTERVEGFDYVGFYLNVNVL